MNFISCAVETLENDSRNTFTSKHLAKVLDKCFKNTELDDYVVTEDKEKSGQTVQVERTIKGLVSKCLEKDAVAFKALEHTRCKTKEYRLNILSECRPERCVSAVDLFLWLVEVCCCVCARLVGDAVFILTVSVVRGRAEERRQEEGSWGVGERVWRHQCRSYRAAGNQQVPSVGRGAEPSSDSCARQERQCWTSGQSSTRE